MKENFGVHCHVRFILAPMEDVTDIVFGMLSVKLRDQMYFY